MLRRKYNPQEYNKKNPVDDSNIKYFILYEGIDKEPNYFQFFNDVFLEEKRIYVHHILESNTPIKGNMPKNLHERAVDFIKNPPKNLKFTPSADDKFRFVLDVDKHPKKQIEDLKKYSDSLFDSKIFISNYCFEVWLWAHLDELQNIKSTKSSEIKTELGLIQNKNGINFPHSYMSANLIREAITRSKKTDLNKEDYFPTEKSTKVYLLIEELLEYSILNESVKNPETL